MGERITPADRQAINPAPDFIFVKSEYRIQKINLDDMLFLEGLRDYVMIHTKQGKIMTLQSMRSLEEVLVVPQFVRVHKSYLIRVGSINHIERNRIIIGEHVIPVGDTYRDGFRKLLTLPL